MFPRRNRNSFMNPYQSAMYNMPQQPMQQPPIQQQPIQQQPIQQQPYMPPMNMQPNSPNPNMNNFIENPNEPENTDEGLMTVAPGDPPPILSNNPSTVNIVLHKELTGYPNYGNPSRNADILYTGNRGTWTFDAPNFLFVPGNLRAQLIIRGVLDDHSAVPVNRYSARITVNGNVVHTGRVPLEHGVPVGGMFNNWRELPFNFNLRGNNRITIVNTSTAGLDDWIGLDWMELRLFQR